MQIARRSRCFEVLALAAALTAGCKSDQGTTGPIGGQSGTDGAGSEGCIVSEEMAVGFEQVTAQGTPAALRDVFARVIAAQRAVPLRWTPRLGGTTTMELAITQWGTEALWSKFVTVRGQSCGERLSVPVTLKISSADGLIDEAISGSINGHQFAGALELSGELQSAFGRELPERLKANIQLDSCGMLFEYGEQFGRTTFQGQLAATADADDELVHALSELGTFDREWPANTQIGRQVITPAAFTEACGSADWQPVPFASDAPGRIPVGRWLLCEGEMTGVLPHAGLEIAADGSWKHLQERAGTVSELLGFEHEGRAIALNGGGVNFLGHSLAVMALSRDKKKLRLTSSDNGFTKYELSYVLSNVPVVPARPHYVIGERAGDVACIASEAHVRYFASSDDLRAQLVGSWSFCSGAFRPDATRITFASDGSYLHQDSAGRTVASGRYEISDQAEINGRGAFQVNLADDIRSEHGPYHTLFLPVMSRAPVKLHANARGEDEPVTILTALP